MTRDLQALPKANLHLHLTGAMRPSTLTSLADRYGADVPPPFAEGVVHGWDAFQSRYDLARSLLRTGDDIHRVVTETLEDNQADGCRWVELQVDPTSYAPMLGSLEAALEAVLSAVESQASKGIHAGVIVASSWARSGAHASKLANLAKRYADKGVVGFGMSNDERLGVVADFAEAFRIARKADLLATPHGGFYEGAWHVRACIETLGANRIGHGITAASDPALLALLASSNITLEICPTSYPPFGVAAEGLPIKELLAAGVPVALGSDDPLLFSAGVTDQFFVVRQKSGLDDLQLAQLARTSATASRAPSSLQREMLAAIDAWCAP